MDVAVSNEFKWYESTFIFASRFFFFARERERESGEKFSRVVSHARETGWRKIRYRRILFLRRFLRHFWYTGNKENSTLVEFFFSLFDSTRKRFSLFFFFKIKWESDQMKFKVRIESRFPQVQFLGMITSQEEVFRATNRVENCGNSGGIYCQEDDTW